ncbi:hypothetical protein AWN90_00625 [Nocardia terpenica]|uniref:Uncharacterized protein n=1 Tax=Nocardia terpenica TaxID=455432 RepID=A0A164KEJ2_9NOCA|nr:hypothetical protein AWN90_00625 [Nocardia terpenica]
MGAAVRQHRVPMADHLGIGHRRRQHRTHRLENGWIIACHCGAKQFDTQIAEGVLADGRWHTIMVGGL